MLHLHKGPDKGHTSDRVERRKKPWSDVLPRELLLPREIIKDQHKLIIPSPVHAADCKVPIMRKELVKCSYLDILIDANLLNKAVRDSQMKTCIVYYKVNRAYRFITCHYKSVG